MPRQISHKDKIVLVSQTIAAIAQPVIVLADEAIIIAANAPARQLLPGLKLGESLLLALRTPDILDAVRAVLAGNPARSVFWRQRVPVELIFEVYVAPLILQGLSAVPTRVDVVSAAEAAHANDAIRRAKIPLSYAGETDNLVMVSMRDLTHAHLVERMRVDFIANASHELRTPLASLLGFIETLQGAAKDDAQARNNFLAIMREQAQRMARLVDDLLSLSGIEQRQNVRPEQPIDLGQIVGHVADTLSLLARENGMTLNLDLAMHALIAGDRDELVRLVENLVENAIKYGKQEGDDVARTKVDITVAVMGTQVYFSVRDYGMGIAQEHLPRLTERFYRINIDQSRAKGGTGLGLAIVKHIVARHRGRLSIESREGQGANFSVMFPCFVKS